jgi:hypothetical protein
MGKSEIELRGWGALHRLGERRLGVLTGMGRAEVNVHEHMHADSVYKTCICFFRN